MNTRFPISARFRPRKSLGQNFLTDTNTRQKIIDACDLRQEDVVLEIGPGKGALTRLIAPRVKSVIAVEKDKMLAGILKERFSNTNVTVIHADILRYAVTKNIDARARRIKIIGNLPYNISTAIIETMLRQRRYFHSFYMTVQREYARRLTARPHSKDYGSFSCFVQYYAAVKKMFNIDKACFSPRPRVQSTFLHLKVREKPEFPVQDEEKLFLIIRGCFEQRRKTIENSLSRLSGKPRAARILTTLDINPKARPEDLALEDYVRIADIVSPDGTETEIFKI